MPSSFPRNRESLLPWYQGCHSAPCQHSDHSGQEEPGTHCTVFEAKSECSGWNKACWDVSCLPHSLRFSSPPHVSVRLHPEEGRTKSSPGPGEAAAVHISRAQNSLEHLEPRGGSCDPPAVFSQAPGAQAPCAVKGCLNPIPPENLGEMGCKDLWLPFVCSFLDRVCREQGAAGARLPLGEGKLLWVGSGQRAWCRQCPALPSTHWAAALIPVGFGKLSLLPG